MPGMANSDGDGMKAQEAASAPPKQHPPKRRSPVKQWRALWDLEDGQPAWLRDAVAAMDGAIQGQMGHT
jgi:hypothetical protein